MKRIAPILLTCLLLVAATVHHVSGQDAGKPDRVALLKRHIPPLTHPRGDRWSILVWGNPTGLEPIGAMVERGISPMFNNTRTGGGIKQNLPALKLLQQRDVPVVILPQGLVQVTFMKRGRRPGVDHRAPARGTEVNHDFTCPALMVNHPWLGRDAARTGAICRALEDGGITPAGILIDFETGVYLRNGAERADRLTPAMREALRCPRCIKTFGADKMNTLEKYGALANRVRAEVQRKLLVEPVHKVFPDCHTGNFYAWPARRLPLPEDEYPAYGFEGSGMTVAQPRRYLTAGWRGSGRDRDKADWIGWLSCIETYSPAASVMKEGELLVPWIGYVWSRTHGREKRGHAFPSEEATAEIMRHAMLRGAETMAVFMPHDIGSPFPKHFGDIPEKELGPWLMMMRGLVRGYNDMLRFHAFLRTARPVHFEVSGSADKLGAGTANYSAMADDERALVRTVCFGDTVTRTIRLFDRDVELSFPRGGAFYWVPRNGPVVPIEPDDYPAPEGE